MFEKLVGFLEKIKLSFFESTLFVSIFVFYINAKNPEHIINLRRLIQQIDFLRFLFINRSVVEFIPELLTDFVCFLLACSVIIFLAYCIVVSKRLIEKCFAAISMAMNINNITIVLNIVFFILYDIDIEYKNIAVCFFGVQTMLYCFLIITEDEIAAEDNREKTKIYMYASRYCNFRDRVKEIRSWQKAMQLYSTKGNDDKTL